MRGESGRLSGIMSDDHKEPVKKSKRWMIAVGLPVSYVLSFGPFCWTTSFIMSHVSDPSRVSPAFRSVYDFLYGPLIWCMMEMQWFNDVMRWYALLFVWSH